MEALNKHPQTKAPQKQTTQKLTNQKDLKVKDLDSDGMTNTHAPGKKMINLKRLKYFNTKCCCYTKNKSAQQTDKQVKNKQINHSLKFNIKIMILSF